MESHGVWLQTGLEGGEECQRQTESLLGCQDEAGKEGCSYKPLGNLGPGAQGEAGTCPLCPSIWRLQTSVLPRREWGRNWKMRHKEGTFIHTLRVLFEHNHMSDLLTLVSPRAQNSG